MNSDASQGTGPVFPPENQQYDNMNSKVTLSAVVSLSVVILVVLILHIYARCAMRRTRQARASVRQLPLRDVGPHPADQPKAGLEPRVIASLPSFIVNDVDSPDGDQGPTFECAVCLSGLEAGEAARLLPNCKHRFHVECIDTWLGGQSTCPICRTEVAPWTTCPICRTEVAPWTTADGEAPTAPPMEGEGASESGGGSVQGSAKEGGSSSSRLSSFRRIMSRDWSSSRRIQPLGLDVVQDLERL